jgi:hypothetical protein
MTLSDVPARAVLRGVPRVHFYEGGPRCPEDIPFASCLRACLEYLGENLGCQHVTGEDPSWGVGCGYAYLLGASGTAFSHSWKPGWHPDNADPRHIPDDAATDQPVGAAFRRAFAAVGYGCEVVYRMAERDNESQMRQRIADSIVGKGLPVLALGVVGPPECCIVTGYDEGGDVLIGWSFFQNDAGFSAGVDFEPSGCFRKRGWYADTEGLILFGEKRERPELRQVYREGLQWALHVMRTPMAHGDCRNGLAAYAAWADHVLRDEDLSADDVDRLRFRHMVHNGAVGYIAEARWYGATFLGRAAETLPAMAVELYAAASCCAAEHELMWEMWDQAGGIGNPEAYLRFAEPEVRRRIAPIILQARERDAQAAAHIEAALCKKVHWG